jgi:hypothetical protein
MLMLFSGPMAVMAQDSAPLIETASLRLWPEYDDPGLLVISAGSFENSTELPMQAAFPLPKARAYPGDGGRPGDGLVNRQWEVVEDNLTYTSTCPTTTLSTTWIARPPARHGRSGTRSRPLIG